GRNRLLDAEGLDWWELTAIFFHQQIELLGVLRRFAENLKSSDELYITRPGFYADALRFLLRDRLQVLSSRIESNRSALRYVRTVPELNFLLVATRRSGWLADASANVTMAKLASYAKDSLDTSREYEELLQKWQIFRAELESVPEIFLLRHLRCLDSFPKLLRQGLAIRDAWRQVFETEPVKAVLCADDSNPYTRIPVILARNRGIPAIACHPGPLDGRHLFKQNHADVILAKGKMEQDYL